MCRFCDHGAEHRKRLSKGAVAGCAAAILAITGTGITSAAARPAAPGVQQIQWKSSCQDKDLRKAKAQCGLLSVPLDHDRPRGKQIQLAVSRIKAKVPAAQRQGIMLTSPGGPGASGIYLPILGAYVPGGAGDLYDWIGFDPRGVGESRPAVTCVPDFFEGPRPYYAPASEYTIDANERAWIKRSKNYAKECGRNNGALLEHMRTTDEAKDLDLIRAALGENKLNFYGFSYGTYLAQVYATIFPDRVRRMVLDGNVAPDNAGYTDDPGRQTRAFEGAVQVFWEWVARHDDVYDLGATAKEVETQCRVA